MLTEIDPRLMATKAYDVQQLQFEFHTFSPRDTYIYLCQHMDCKPILPVAALFPSAVGAWDNVQSLDLSTTYVGAKGARPVIELCKRLPKLIYLSLADNYLNNDTLWHLAQMAVFHPSLQEIELSNNEFISWSGAMCLAELVLRNSHITCLGLRNTGIQTLTSDALFAQTRKNAIAMYRDQEKAPNPSNHPSAIYLRAMKRFFDTCAEKDDEATVPADCLIDGFKERLRVLGKEHAFSQYTEEWLEELKARAPAARVHWEAFLVLVLIDESVYSDGIIGDLQTLFMEFNMDPEAGLSGGIVQVSDLFAIYARLYGEGPKDNSLSILRDRLGLDDTMTINWDEFLFVFYARMPSDTVAVAGAFLTPLPRSGRVLHH